MMQIHSSPERVALKDHGAQQGGAAFFYNVIFGESLNMRVNKQILLEETLRNW